MNESATITRSFTAEEQRNMEACRRVLTKVWQGGELDICDEVFTEDFVRHDANGPDAIGPKGYKDLVSKTRQAFPDLRVEINDLTPVGRVVFFRTRMLATHTGEFHGIKPTGAKVVAETHAEVHFNDDGMSVEAWVISNYLGTTQAIINAMSWWQLLVNAPALIREMKHQR